MLFLPVLALAACLSGALAAALFTEARRRRPAPSGEEAAALRAPAAGVQSAAQATASLLPSAVLCFLLVAALYFAARLSKGVQEAAQGQQSGSCSRPGAQERIQLFTPQLDGFTHAIHAGEQAQLLFSQGLLLEFAFNQFEANAAFELAAASDRNACMPLWGQAYALGPGANRAVVERQTTFPAFGVEHFGAAAAVARRALELARAAAAVSAGPLAAKELMYAEAAMARFVPGSERQPARDAAERRYAELMCAAGEAHNDSHAFAIAAEGFMNIVQWAYHETGEGGALALKPEAAEAARLLERALRLDPANPLAHHLRIHLTEAASPTEGAGLSAVAGLPSADAMTHSAGPWDRHAAHLLHMPGHSYGRVGRYHDAVVASVRAYEADTALARACLAPYAIEHNADMLIYAANMAGQARLAEEHSARLSRMQVDMPTAAYGDPTREWTHLPLSQVLYARWEAVLAIPGPPPLGRGMCPPGGPEYAALVYHYARTLALAARAAGAAARGASAPAAQAVADADAELARLQAAELAVEEEEPTLPAPGGRGKGLYACEYALLARIAALTAAGRVALLHGDAQTAVERLREAAAAEDGMSYFEPPRWYQPSRHCLGFVLLNATGDAAAAEQVFREDLAEHPSTGFALLGLAGSLAAQGRAAEADAARAEFERAWRWADAPLASSCPAFSERA